MRVEESLSRTVLLSRMWAAVRRFWAGLRVPALGAPWAYMIVLRRQRRLARVFADLGREFERSSGPPAVVRPQAECGTGITVVRPRATDGSGVHSRLCPALALPGAHLLDLRAATEVAPSLCTQIAGEWAVSADDVPRLGVLLPFEGWATMRNEVVLALEPVAQRGIQIEVFYEEQLGGQIAEWFRSGVFQHNVAGVLSELSTRWRPPAVWPRVIDVLETLVRTEVAPCDQPPLLVTLGELALSCGGADIALRLATEVLRGLPREPSAPVALDADGHLRIARRLRNRVLRQLAASLMATGRTEEGVAMMDHVIELALKTRDNATAARAMCQRAMFALNHADYVCATLRFRAVIPLLTSARSVHSRAVVHHNLALALLHRHQFDAATHHVREAMMLRADQHSHWAEEDRLLIAKIREVRRAH